MRKLPCYFVVFVREARSRSPEYKFKLPRRFNLSADFQDLASVLWEARGENRPHSKNIYKSDFIFARSRISDLKLYQIDEIISTLRLRFGSLNKQYQEPVQTYSRSTVCRTKHCCCKFNRIHGIQITKFKTQLRKVNRYFVLDENTLPRQLRGQKTLINNSSNTLFIRSQARSKAKTTFLFIYYNLMEILQDKKSKNSTAIRIVRKRVSDTRYEADWHL